MTNDRYELPGDHVICTMPDGAPRCLHWYESEFVKPASCIDAEVWFMPGHKIPPPVDCPFRVLGKQSLPKYVYVNGCKCSFEMGVCNKGVKPIDD